MLELNPFSERITLDTNILLDRTLEQILRDYKEPTEFILPLSVLEELDKFKKGFELKNVMSRDANKFLDKLRKKGNLSEGVLFENHLVRVSINKEELDINKNDYKILKAAMDEESTLITSDINLRIVADSVGLHSKEYDINQVKVEEMYTGYTEFDLSSAWIDIFFSENYIPISTYKKNEEEFKLKANEFVVMKDEFGGKHLGIFKKERNRIEALERHYEGFAGYSPKKNFNNEEIIQQKFMYHLLLDKEINFVSLIGPSGSGKTFGTFACALKQVIETEEYKRVIVMRTLNPVGENNNIGFLPGDEIEKLKPWMGSTFDTLDKLLEDYKIKDCDSSVESKIERLIDEGMLKLDALAFIRGRSISDSIIIIDDAQNLSIHEATTIITRASEGTKVIFLGDLSEKQIDNHRVSAANSGLSYVTDRLKDSEIVGHITFPNDPSMVIRSPLAQLGVERL